MIAIQRATTADAPDDKQALTSAYRQSERACSCPNFDKVVRGNLNNGHSCRQFRVKAGINRQGNRADHPRAAGDIG
jgi:hypothetical protein